MIRLRLKSFAAASFGFYLLLNVFLTHCLIQPHNAHIQGQATSSLASICAWVHKTVSPHAPSVVFMLPVIVAILFLLVLPVSCSPQFQLIGPTGRSPPRLYHI